MLQAILAAKDAICVQMWVAIQFQHRQVKAHLVELSGLLDASGSQRMRTEFTRVNRLADHLHYQAVQQLSVVENFLGVKWMNNDSHEENERLENLLWQEMIKEGLGVDDILGEDKFHQLRSETERMLNL